MSLLLLEQLALQHIRPIITHQQTHVGTANVCVCIYINGTHVDVLLIEFYMVSSGIPPLTVLLLYILYFCLCLRRGSVPHVRVFAFVALSC